MSKDDVVLVERLEGDAFWRVILNTPKGNILDQVMMSRLAEVFHEARETSGVKAVCLEGAGVHFSFGASVEEHRKDQVAAMLATFHELVRQIFSASVTCLAAVRGQCLGGGLEVVTACHRIFAAPTARLGQPEIRLGVFAPVASVLLPERIGRPAAEDLCLSGRVLTADEALQVGLVDVIAEDPTEAALAYYHEFLAPHSATALHFAVRALRGEWLGRVAAELDRLERMYVTELMDTHDAVEGIEAFLQKRPPEWRNS